MTDYRITYWQDIPAMLTARDGSTTAKSGLPDRFQEAIDRAAMEQGLTGSEAYLAQWRYGEWIVAEGSPDEVVSAVARQIDAEYPPERLDELVVAR
jgi:hypothetical protein